MSMPEFFTNPVTGDHTLLADGTDDSMQVLLAALEDHGMRDLKITCTAPDGPWDFRKPRDDDPLVTWKVRAEFWHDHHEPITATSTSDYSRFKAGIVAAVAGLVRQLGIPVLIVTQTPDTPAELTDPQ